MFTHSFKWRFIHVLSCFFAVLCLISTASTVQGEENGAPPPTPSTIPTGIHPPSVEQALVPESVFAMQLAKALKLAPVPDEAKAEELLSGLGIEPKNGWISEYPVTPAVLGDIEKETSEASDQGKISLTKDQALKLVDDVKARLGLEVNPGTNAPPGLIKNPGNSTIYIYTDNKGVINYTDNFNSIPKEYRGLTRVISHPRQHELSSEAGSGTAETQEPQNMANLNPDDINNYYYEQGPPVVTYYSPPDPYYYLYSWVPYPFWSTGFYFPGFFVLNNFHRHIFFNQHRHFVSHHDGGAAFHHPLSIGAVNRNFPEHSTPDGMASSRWFSAPNALAGARTIIMLHQNRNRSINATREAGINASRPRQPLSFSEHSRIINNAPFRPAPHSGGARTFNPPALNQRTEIPNTPRFSAPHTFPQDRVFRSPRSFGGNAVGRPDGGGGGGEFHHGGNSMSHGGNFPGASGGHGGHR
ncbi:MAG TPA: hypothetical protein VIF37_02040 [Methylobacter sp.]|jgi:hypothetical protein